MSEDHRRGKDGLFQDGASSYPADAHDMQTYTDAQQKLSQFQAPILLNRANTQQRLYIAAFDGTGNDGLQNPEHATNVDNLRRQIQDLRDEDSQLGYLPGPGT